MWEIGCIERESENSAWEKEDQNVEATVEGYFYHHVVRITKIIRSVGENLYKPHQAPRLKSSKRPSAAASQSATGRQPFAASAGRAKTPRSGCSNSSQACNMVLRWIGWKVGKLWEVNGFTFKSLMSMKVMKVLKKNITCKSGMNVHYKYKLFITPKQHTDFTTCVNGFLIFTRP